MTWVLDACVLIRAQGAGMLDELLHAAAQCPIALTDEVYAELTDPMSTKIDVRRRAAAAKEAIDASQCAIVHISLAGPVADIVAHLRGQRATPNDAGECASIAYAALSPDHWFVTSDRTATFVATREIDGRTVSLPWYLRKLVGAGALKKRVAEAILENDKTRAPAWWAAWVSND